MPPHMQNSPSQRQIGAQSGDFKCRSFCNSAGDSAKLARKDFLWHGSQGSTPVAGKAGRYNSAVQTGKYSHPPKQARSRKSFERVLEVATELLEKHGFNGFSIVDVSRRSKISIGSIYGRVAGKDDLVRSVQERVLNNADREHDAFLQNLDHERLTLKELFPLAVQHHADFWLGTQRSFTPSYRGPATIR
jgi:hypothetical protein